MEISEALHVLKRLVEGVNPSTGKPLDQSSIYGDPRFIRAVYIAISALEEAERRLGFDAVRPGPPERWSELEDEELCTEFEQHLDWDVIAGKHGRTTGEIIRRLVRLGKIELEEY